MATPRLSATDVPVGTQYGFLITVSEPYAPRGGGASRLRVRCSCGQEKDVELPRLRTGQITSCGCRRGSRLTALDVPIGTTYGLLEVISEPFIPPGKHASVVMVRCACGAEKTVAMGSLRSGSTRSCGCARAAAMALAHKTHGLTRHPLYRLWASIKDRTCNEASNAWDLYGGRGITMCPEWRNDPVAFINWIEENLGPRPGPEWSLDRYPDNGGNYEPGNLRWATASQQARNRRLPGGPMDSAEPVNYIQEAERHYAAEIAAGCVPSVNRMRRDLRIGWTTAKKLEAHFTAPVRSRRRTVAEATRG